MGLRAGGLDSPAGGVGDARLDRWRRHNVYDVAGVTIPQYVAQGSTPVKVIVLRTVIGISPARCRPRLPAAFA